MKRTLSVLLIGLFVLVAMAAPRPAAADFGSNVFIIGVSSTGTTPLREMLVYGQRQTALDHSGCNLCVDVWKPTGAYTGDLRVSFRGRRGTQLNTVGVFERGRMIGEITTFAITWLPYADGACVLDVEGRWGARQVLHNLWIR